MCAAVEPAVSLSMHSLLSMVSFVDHVDHTVPSAPRLERPGDGEDGAVESQMERSGKLHWFGCVAAQPRCRPWETGARGTTDAGLGGWSKKTRG